MTIGLWILPLSILFACLLFSFLFNLAEMSFLNIDRVRLRKEVMDRIPSALAIHRLTSNPLSLFGTLLLGITAFLQISSILFTYLFYPLVSHIPYLMDILVLLYTLIVILFIEAFPQILALREPYHFARRTLPFVRLFQALAYPVVWLLTVIPRTLMGETSARSFLTIPPPSRKRLFESLLEGPPSEEATVIYRVLRAAETPATAVMTPRKGIVFVKSSDPLEMVFKTFRDTQFSRLPVCTKSLDDATRFLHVKDLLQRLEMPTEDWLSLTRTLPSFSEFTSLYDLLKRMRGQAYIVLLKNPRNQVSGLLTMEDILEYLKGKIEDEYD